MRFLSLLLFIAFLFDGCDEKFKPRTAGSKPLDDDEGLPGYLDEANTNYEKKQAFKVDFHSVSVTSPDGAVNADGHVSLRRHPISEEIAELGGVDIEAIEGEPVEVILFDSDHKILDKDQILKSLRFYRRDLPANSKSNLSMLLVENPRGEVPRRYQLSDDQLIYEGDPSYALASQSSVQFEFTSTHFVFFAVDKNGLKSPTIALEIDPEKISDATQAEKQEVKTNFYATSVNLSGSLDTNFATDGKIIAADFFAGNIVDFCVSDKIIYVTGARDLTGTSEQLSLACFGEDGKLCENFDTVAINGNLWSEYHNFSIIHCAEDGSVFLRDPRDSKKITKYLPTGSVDETYSNPLNNISSISGDPEIPIIKKFQDDSLIFAYSGSVGADRKNILQKADSSGNAVAEFGSDGKAETLAEVSLQSLIRTLHITHAGGIYQLAIDTSESENYGIIISDLKADGKTELTIASPDKFGTWVLVDGLFLKTGEFLIIMKNNENLHKAYLYKGSGSPMESVAIDPSINILMPLYGSAMIRLADDSIFYQVDSADSNLHERMVLTADENTGQKSLLRLAFEDSENSKEVYCGKSMVKITPHQAGAVALCLKDSFGNKQLIRIK